MGKKYYLCIEMSWKGLISRMSDECLMKQETVFSFYTQYQAVMRKFTLAWEICAALSVLAFTRVGTDTGTTTQELLGHDSFTLLFIKVHIAVDNSYSECSALILYRVSHNYQLSIFNYQF